MKYAYGVLCTPVVSFAETGGTMSTSGSGLKVLIVEDSSDARKTLRMMISFAHGHSVLEAPDGARGVELAIAHKPDVALVDLGLPDFDGNEVARRIRSTLGHDVIRLIALTGYDSAEDRQRSAEAGFDAHLVKPVDHAVLAGIFADVQTRATQG
jgi:two-component system, sensor histidine kinase